VTTGATLDEIGKREKLWTLSAERMKSDREHRIPLAGHALDLVEEMKTFRLEGEFIFPGGKRGKPLKRRGDGRRDRSHERGEREDRPAEMDGPTIASASRPAWLPLNVQRLGKRVYQLSQHRLGNGFGSQGERQSRDSLPAWRAPRRTQTVDGGLGRFHDERSGPRR
jgi:hypothetical protein